jgi:hypothetical protein
MKPNKTRKSVVNRRRPRRGVRNEKKEVNGFNKQAAFHTVSTYVGNITIPAATTAFRVDIIPALSVFPIAATSARFMTYRAH